MRNKIKRGPREGTALCKVCQILPRMAAIKKITTIPDVAQINDENISYRLECPTCGSKTADYKDKEKAYAAWDALNQKANKKVS